MVNDYYLLIDGINGETQTKDMKNNIDIWDWNFGGISEASLGGKGLSAGKAELKDFTCSFWLDTSSYQILRNICKGTHIGTATLTARKTGGGQEPYKYLTVTMSNCFVTRFHTQGGSTGIPLVRLALAFQSIAYQYYTQDTFSGATVLAGTAKYNSNRVDAA